MSTITLTREGGSPTPMTMRSAFRQLAPNIDVDDVLMELGRRECASVVMADGTKATIEFTDRNIEPDLDEPVLDRLTGEVGLQRDLDLPVPDRETILLHADEIEVCEPIITYVDLWFKFPVRASILVHTSDLTSKTAAETRAEELVRDVVNGSVEPPPGFHLAFDEVRAADFIRNAVNALHTGDFRKCDADMQLTAIQSGYHDPSYRAQLTYDPQADRS